MIDPTQIPDGFKEKELRILRLKEMADRAFFGFMRESYLKDMRWLEQHQETDLLDFLFEGSDVISKLIQENHQLIANTQIDFAVAKETAASHNAYAKELSGYIHSNGYLYLETDETNFFVTNDYPIQYRGHINAIGKSAIKASQMKFKLFTSRISQRFLGSISDSGQIEMNTTETDLDFDGRLYITRIIADPFKGDGNKTEQFMENISSIRSALQELRASLLK